MDKYSFYDEIKNEYSVLELDSSTLNYRINGFIYACGMDLSNSPCIKCISKNRVPYINKNNEDGIKYNINFTRSYNRENGNSFVLLGKYDDLNLMFINFFDEDKRKDRINEIPFHISLGKIYNDIAYQLEIKTTSKMQARFILKKNKEMDMFPNKLIFNANITDFSRILKMVKSFVHNPELVFIAYNEVMNRKKIVFTNKDLDIALVKDEKLDKPTNKTFKILRKLTNND